MVQIIYRVMCLLKYLSATTCISIVMNDIRKNSKVAFVGKIQQEKQVQLPKRRIAFNENLLVFHCLNLHRMIVLHKKKAVTADRLMPDDLIL